MVTCKLSLQISELVPSPPPCNSYRYSQCFIFFFKYLPGNQHKNQCKLEQYNHETPPLARICNRAIAESNTILL
jgi:hypothetical protein